MGRFLKRKKRNRKLKADLKDQMEEQQIRAKFSKKQAKKLKKIYGDLSPEEVNQINEIQPYVGGMASQLQEQGVEVENPDDPIEVAAKYNTEILDEPQPEGYEAFDGFTNGFDKEKAKGLLKIGIGAITGAFGARKAIAEQKAMKGEPLNTADKAVIAIKEEEAAQVRKAKNEKFGDVLSKALPIGLVALIFYLIFK